MALHNPNNWHWVNKDVSAWTRGCLDQELPEIKAEQDGCSAQISKVLSMDGDVDVSQRKGKVITIYDVKMQLEFTGMSSMYVHALHELTDRLGKTKDDEDVSGTITIPEVAHDTEEDEYVVCVMHTFISTPNAHSFVV